MLIDANILIYAVHSRAPQHEAASSWLTEQLNGSRRVGLPWQSLGAFLRIASHPRGFTRPLSPHAAWEHVADWLDAPAAWVPEPGAGYREILRGLVETHAVAANLVPDAMLAALAIEHGVAVCSADSDFARFGEVRWENPLRGS